MVVDLQSQATPLDDVFHALADATRRDIVARALTEERSVSALARAYPISLTAVQKHVAVLERAGLVTRRRRGREQIVTTEPRGLARAHAALDALEAGWRGRIERMQEILETTNEGASE
jgi:DNA-binding transcriptional ArsR family regulator